VVRSNPDVSFAFLDQLEHRLENSDHRTIRTVHPFVEPAKTVEVTEQLVSPINQMNDQLINWPSRR
jgi:hypothetical protein